MRIQVDASTLGQTKWQEYLVRFVFGGLITAVAELIAKEFGPSIGGLFLAFPAIFPATATLIERHERQKKEREGLQGTERGRQATSVDAAGSAMGSIGLPIFALVAWQFLSKHNPVAVLAVGTLGWFLSSVLTWWIRKRI